MNCHLNNKKEPARQKSGIIAFYVERWQGVAWGRQCVQRSQSRKKLGVLEEQRGPEQEAELWQQWLGPKAHRHNRKL